MAIKTIIVEDEVNARKALVNMLEFYEKDVEIIGQAKNLEEGIELIKNNQPDLVLLDVRLPDGTGFDLISKLKKYSFKLVFVTAYNEYALKAIKLSALDYLLKPVKPNELNRALDKVREAVENEEQLKVKYETAIENFSKPAPKRKIILNTVDSMYVLEVSGIIRCEASENYTSVYAKDKGRIMLAKTLKDFEEMLVPFGFFRVHQSHLVNLQYVDTYEKRGSGRVLLKNGEKIPVSTRRKEGFLRALEAII
ncbi:MAG: LytTR family DNA-binding domain-containing protein [Bacteroidales bacterium]|nr:LytTR family DNA-binding domain-containing protein [Bacteroidales bacterium]MCF8344909.1 LytTR family DNA-binding domain-containing protein [Bacteroidales bacterium]MCF8349946.1 LytTR family DNA-binding domain-containing protein [Bacteroidales bacterium]MCF8375463.1 LytTR family DNA-binding domain-containing protein [Bacteroidales bacterium]MCF8402113.1 LytTR family DNA-binding domain-containing protein [Bacteroidales bacterium]